MALTICRSLKRVDLEMAIGQPTRSLVRQVLSWVVWHTTTNAANWQFFRLGSELCSSPSNSLALLIAGLWLRWKHVRYTGEAAYSLRAWLSENTTLPQDTREVCSESEWGVAAYALIQEEFNF